MKKYLITRHGSNAANQKRTRSAPVGIVESQDAESAVQQAHDGNWLESAED